jgi:hypothetical protein
VDRLSAVGIVRNVVVHGQTMVSRPALFPLLVLSLSPDDSSAFGGFRDQLQGATFNMDGVALDSALLRRHRSPP